MSPHHTGDGRFALVVSLRIVPDRRERFLRAISENAAASVAEESGDEDAFDHHRTTAHFARWREVAAEYLRPVDGQNNTYLTRLHPATPGNDGDEAAAGSTGATPRGAHGR